MPSEKVLKEKEAIVASIAEEIKNAATVVFVDARGLTVEKDTELRAGLRKAGVSYKVRKNTLTLKAVRELGLEGLEDAPEDVLCGRYIKGILEGKEPDMRKELETLRKDPTVQRFFDPENQVFPEADYWMCTEVDRFDFVLRVDRLEEDVFEVHRTDV